MTTGVAGGGCDQVGAEAGGLEGLAVGRGSLLVAQRDHRDEAAPAEFPFILHPSAFILSSRPLSCRHVPSKRLREVGWLRRGMSAVVVEVRQRPDSGGSLLAPGEGAGPPRSRSSNSRRRRSDLRSGSCTASLWKVPSES